VKTVRPPDKAGITRSNTADVTLNRARDYSTVFLRIALGISFLSAVADRFGLWGAYGQPNVAWGDFSRFVIYTGKLNWFAPTAMIPVLAWAANLAEALLGLALVLGFFTRVAALWSRLMLLLFALTMTFGLGVKAPLDLSVFSASAGAFLLAAYGKSPLSIDALRHPHESLVSKQK
jgi:uncharacterized membrane protein YphA (DoxX/SURF4 family)